jgi:HEAT repeat protein
MSLYQLERDGDLETLTETLDRSQNPSIRRRAAEIIGGLFESDDLADADLVLGDDAPTKADIEPIDGADADRTTVIDVLVAAVTSDEDRQVRAAAIDALDKHGTASLERVIAELSDVDLDSAAEWVTAQAFVEALSDDRPELRMAAASGLGRIGDSNATSALVERLADPDPRVRTRSAIACGRIGDPRAVEPLEARLRDDSSVDVRRAAADALGEIGTEGAMGALLGSDDDSVTVRRVVADALGQFGSIEPVDALVDFLGDDDETVRRTAMFSLVETLSNAPPQRSHDVRNAAADRLGSATSEEVTPPLSEILTESSGAPQRRNAAWLLGRVVGDSPDVTARTALVSALGDDDAMTAQFAATSLARLPDPALESELLELSTDPDAALEARSKALFVLGKVGGERTRAELAELVDDTEHDELREGAFSALSKLGGLGGGEHP